MEQKPSHFAWINRMREKLEKHNQKAADEAAAYAEQRQHAHKGGARKKNKHKK